MVVGFNHNFRYKGEVFHVQTEDGGIKSPQIVTLLYSGGTILSSKKTSYAELCQRENLAALVEGLMKEQHRDMLRRLKDGEFDAVIERKMNSLAADVAALKKPTAQQASSAPEASSPPPSRPAPAAAVPVVEADLPPVLAAADLDDIILTYLLGDDY